MLAVGASGDAGGVFAALSTAYTVHAEPATTLQWTWLDTADWRLHRAGIALREERRGRQRELVVEGRGLDGAGGDTTLTASAGGVTWPSRLDRITASPVRDAIAGTVGVRALLPVAEVETRRILLRLMDDIGKTRVRVSVDQQRLLLPRKAALPLHVAVRPLRGYDDDARRCVELLAEAMGAETTALSPTDAALAAAGRLPGSPADDRAPLSVRDPAVWPVARALLDHVAVVDDARDGALADLDTEFLRELRAAIRSTRALLGVAGHLLTGRSAVRVERDLAWLDEQTSPLRAVDIALLELAGDGGTDLGGLSGADLDPLRDELRRRRRTELRRMRATLRAPRAPAAFTTWRRDLTGMAEADVIGPSAGEAAVTLTRSAYDAAVSAGDDAFPLHLAALSEVLTAFAPIHPEGRGSSLRADLDELRELLRLRDGVRIVRAELTAAARSGARTSAGLPVPTLLAAGAVIDRAGRHARDLDDRVAAARAELTSKRCRRRLEELVA